MRYPIPNRRNEQSVGTGPVIPYKLSDVELAYLRAGDLGKIPTADERGITPEPVSGPIRVPKEAPRVIGRRRKYDVSERDLRRLREAGLTLQQMGAELQMPAESVRWWLKRYGINTARRRADG